MKPNILSPLISIAACFALAWLPGCTEQPAPVGHGGKLHVVATTGMVADLARAVGGEHITVTALMAPGIDPHLYKASADAVGLLESADVILYNGLGLEGKLGDLFVKLAHKRNVTAVTESVPRDSLLDDGQHYDPHVWFDVGIWAQCPAAVADVLSEARPALRETFQAAARKYAAELRALHERVKDRIGAIPKKRRVLITSHDAFRYFGRAYEMEVHGLQGISTVDEAGVKDVQRVVDLVVTRGIKAIFVETSVPKHTIEAVQSAARERGREVVIGGELYSDSMGDHAPENTYIGMVEANVRLITESLR